MKKYITLILFPYFATINIFAFLFSGYLSELPNFLNLLICFFFLAVNIIELFFAVKCLINIGIETFNNNCNTDFMKNILYVKFLHIPAYIFIFVLGFAMLTLPLGFIITICCFIADCWSIFFTGLPMTFTLIAKYRQKEISKKFTVIHSILAFIFCLDIIDGVYLKRRL